MFNKIFESNKGTYDSDRIVRNLKRIKIRKIITMIICVALTIPITGCTSNVGTGKADDSSTMSPTGSSKTEGGFHAKGNGSSILVTAPKDAVVYDASNNPVPESYTISPIPGATSNQILFSLPDGKYSIRTVNSSSTVSEPFTVGISDDDNYIRLSSNSSDFDVTFTFGDAPNLLLSNVDSAIDGQITSTNAGLSMDSLNVEKVGFGTYALSFFGSASSPNPDNVMVTPPLTDDNGAKKMNFTIAAE